MPFIHVRSLPFEQSFSVSAAVKGITRDFAAGTGIGSEHITVTWEFFAPGHYAAGGKTAQHQPQASHPVLVDLLAPDFNSAEDVAKALNTAAASIAERSRIPIGNIFINYRYARAGMVFDSGEIVRW